MSLDPLTPEAAEPYHALWAAALAVLVQDARAAVRGEPRAALGRVIARRPGTPPPTPSKPTTPTEIKVRAERRAGEMLRIAGERGERDVCWCGAGPGWMKNPERVKSTVPMCQIPRSPAFWWCHGPIVQRANVTLLAHRLPNNGNKQQHYTMLHVSQATVFITALYCVLLWFANDKRI